MTSSSQLTEVLCLVILLCLPICFAPGVLIQFDPVTYTVPEGGSTMLRIARVGNADIPVFVTISTVVGTSGDNLVTLLFNSILNAY